MLRFITAVVGLTLASCSATEDSNYRENRSSVVYDNDDRKDHYASDSELFKRITRESIVALIPANRLDLSDPTDIGIQTNTLGQSHNLCDDQLFRDQPTAASCSGTLIGPDLVLTAGHCVSSLRACQSYAYVFDYFYESEGQLETITREDVFECRQVVVAQSRGRVDFGVIQLDRPVPPERRPASVKAGDGPLLNGAPLTVVGFGSGIPAKIDSGGRVLDGRGGSVDYFLASTDTFGGHSGSGVFNEAGEVVGVLVRGERDYIDRGSCAVVNVLSSSTADGGEGVTYVRRAIDGLCADWQSDLCGDTGGWCRACGSDDACPNGWSCERSAQDQGVTWCAKPCGTDGDCIGGHSCESGRCIPQTIDRCYAGDVWGFDTCGRRTAVRQMCPANQICEEDACTGGNPGNACDTAEPIEVRDQTIEGPLDQRYGAGYVGTCGGEGRERIYRFDVDRPTRFVAQASGFDTVLHLRSECEDRFSEVECNDDSTPPGRRGSRIDVELFPGAYFLFLDSFGDRVRNFRLQIAVEFLGPAPDAGVPADTGVALDAAAPVDSGVTAAPDAGRSTNKSLGPVEPSGCACMTPRAPLPWPLVLGLLLVGLRRRRHGA